MAKNIKTHIFCFDDHRGFTEDMRKQFTDTERYTIVSFQTTEEFLNHLELEKENNFCKVAILGVHEAKEQFEMIDQLTIDIKKIDPKTGLILLGPPDRMEDIKKTIRYNIDAYIPKNANSVLRIHNTVKRLISQHGIGIFTRRRNLSFYILMAVILISLLFVLFAYFRLPWYF